MVVAQLVEQLIPTPEVRSLNLVIGKIDIERLLSTLLKFEKTKIKEYRGPEWPIFLKKTLNEKYKTCTWAVAVAQLAEPHGLNPVLGFFKMGHSRPLFYLFLYFQANITNFTTSCEKCPSSIQYRDLNSRPSEDESPPITTRPGLSLQH